MISTLTGVYSCMFNQLRFAGKQLTACLANIRSVLVVDVRDVSIESTFVCKGLLAFGATISAVESLCKQLTRHS